MDENIQDLLETRYFLKDKNGNLIEHSWDDVCKRVSKVIASAEENKKLRKELEVDFYEKHKNFELIASSPCLFNAGTNMQQMSSCFIIDIDDDMVSISNAWQECSIIFKSGGGAGFNISNLRPKDDLVKTSMGKASGVVSFMKIFNIIVEIIKQGGKRKGALKIDLDCTHPEIFDFIDCKNNTEELNNMNISVSITDDFMTRVINNEEIDLKFNNKIYETINAKNLWNKICYSAWKTGEPGLSFRDIMNRDNMNPHLGEIKSTNPCLHKDTYMITENGLEKISKLSSRIYNGNKFTNSKSWKTGIKPIVKVMTNSGFEYIVTVDHKFKLKNGEWCEANDLIGKKIKLDISEKNWLGYNPYPECDYRILGFELGDGVYHKASKRMKYIQITPEKDEKVKNIIEKEFNNNFYITKHNLHEIIIPYNTVYANAFYDKIENRIIPDWIMQLSKKEMADFIKGLFSANGTNLKKYKKIQLVSINKEMLKQVQQMLLLFGIKSKLWYHNKENKIKFKNGKYTCKQSCHLVISRKSYKKFLDKIGFIQDYKNGYYDSNLRNEKDFETVILIEELDNDEVWDFSEPELNQGITNGAYVHNCTEYDNIPYTSCNLLSKNLEKIIKVISYRDLKQNYINYNKLEELTKSGVRFLDNMIDKNELPLNKIEEMTKKIRPIGLGTMGYANMLFLLGIPYNSQEAYKFTHNIYNYIKETAIDESCQIAKEKGTYPAWENSEWHKKDIVIRNGNLLSIAPNGSIAFIAGTTGGIEPEIALVYKRRTNEGKEYFVVNKIFKKVLIERGLYSEELLEKIYQNKGSIQYMKEIPKDIREIFVTSQDLTVEEHIETVSIVQQYVDLSISKTINLPNSATIEDVSNAYIKAWKKGLKGVTVYRDGSRKDQVLSSGDNEDNDIELNRGDIKPALNESKGYRIKLKTGCGSLWLMVFTDENNDIIETFVNTGASGGCTISTQAMSRLISLSLRGGISLEDITDQLESAGVCPSYQYAKGKGYELSSGKSCPSTIAKALKKLQNKLKKEDITNQEEYTIEEELIKENNTNKCPECNSELKNIGGCISCINCGWSKCG